jgi:uncharacterized membrane protein YdjX (TVP38/TMEM64 family)
VWANSLTSNLNTPIPISPNIEDKPKLESGVESSAISTRSLLLSGLGFFALLTALYMLVQSVGIEELQDSIADAGLWGPLIFMGIKAFTYIFAPLSAGPIQFASGILFGVVAGTVYSVLGELIGGSINFMIARVYGRRIVERFVGKIAIMRVDEFYGQYLNDWKSLLVARVLLFSVYDFISYAVGFSRIRFSVYVVVSFIGSLLPTFIFVLIGSEASQNHDILLMFYVGAAVLFLGFVLLRRPLTHYLNQF